MTGSNKELHPGLIGKAEIKVGEQHTARSMGSGRMAVLATPALVAVMEAAAQAAIDALLPAGQQTIGTRIDVRHDGATPVGAHVKATAELTEIDGRTLRFRITAQDDNEAIGEALHDRAITSTATFERLLRQKASRATTTPTNFIQAITRESA